MNADCGDVTGAGRRREPAPRITACISTGSAQSHRGRRTACGAVCAATRQAGTLAQGNDGERPAASAAARQRMHPALALWLDSLCASIQQSVYGYIQRVSSLRHHYGEIVALQFVFRKLASMACSLCCCQIVDSYSCISGSLIVSTNTSPSDPKNRLCLDELQNTIVCHWHCQRCCHIASRCSRWATRPSAT